MRSPFVNLEEVLMSTNFTPGQSKIPIQLRAIPEQNTKQDIKQGNTKSFASNTPVRLNSSNKLNDKYIWGVSIFIIIVIVAWGLVDMCRQRTRMLRIEKMLSMICNKHGIVVL